MTLDILKAFVQIPLPESNKRIIMKLNGYLAEIITEQFPHVYTNGMMMSSLLFYWNLEVI